MDSDEQMEFDALVNRLNDALDGIERLGASMTKLRRENKEMAHKILKLDADAFVWKRRYEQLKMALGDGVHK